MIARSCLACGAVIPRGPRCPDCTSTLNIARGSSHARGYGRRHRLLSEKYRRLVPWCELRYAGCERIAIDADHRVPIRAGGKSVWSNYQSACRACHRTKTAEDRERFPNAI